MTNLPQHRGNGKDNRRRQPRCTAAGCEKPATRHGFCNVCWRRWQHYTAAQASRWRL
jgi:hypothetical protein